MGKRELKLQHVQHVATAADLVIALIESDKNPELMQRLEESNKSVLVSALASFVAALLAEQDYRKVLTKWVEEAAGGVK